jgi:hypothetical protein
MMGNPLVFDDGTCRCARPAQCGGAQIDDSPGSQGTWECTSQDPTALQPGGCPFTAPADGSPCENDGLVCTYGPCSWSQAIGTCNGGSWEVALELGPLPM